MARRRQRHNSAGMLSIEGMGITQKRSLPVITKKKIAGSEQKNYDAFHLRDIRVINVRQVASWESRFGNVQFTRGSKL